MNEEKLKEKLLDWDQTLKSDARTYNAQGNNQMYRFALVNQYGGGVWVLLLNCNDCECVGKLSEIEYAEADESYFA
jgi:hypothetical protein